MYNPDWYRKLKKSPLTPPNYVFGIVWPFLYFTLIIFFLFLLKDSKCRGLCPPLIPFLIQMVLNFSWSPVFFRLQKPKESLVITILMVLLTVYTFYLTYQINQKLSLLLIPYLIWITFATYLNGYIVYQNYL